MEKRKQKYRFNYPSQAKVTAADSNGSPQDITAMNESSLKTNKTNPEKSG